MHVAYYVWPSLVCCFVNLILTDGRTDEQTSSMRAREKRIITNSHNYVESDNHLTKSSPTSTVVR